MKMVVKSYETMNKLCTKIEHMALNSHGLFSHLVT